MKKFLLLTLTALTLLTGINASAQTAATDTDKRIRLMVSDGRDILNNTRLTGDKRIVLNYKKDDSGNPFLICSLLDMDVPIDMVTGMGEQPIVTISNESKNLANGLTLGREIGVGLPARPGEAFAFYFREGFQNGVFIYTRVSVFDIAAGREIYAMLVKPDLVKYPTTAGNPLPAILHLLEDAAKFGVKIDFQQITD